MLKEIYEQKRAIGRTISFCRVIGSTDTSLDEDPEASKNQHLPVEYNDAVWRQLGLTKEKIKNI